MVERTGYKTNRYIDAYGKNFDLLFQKNDQDDIEVYVRTEDNKPYKQLEVWSGIFLRRIHRRAKS